MRAKLQFHSLPFMGKDIVPTDTAKDLGVILDSNLTYDEHVIKTASSCIKKVVGTFPKKILKSRLLQIPFSAFSRGISHQKDNHN